jgi:hypothetical protein
VDGFDRLAAAPVARVGEVDAEVAAGRDDRARGLADTIHSTGILTIKGVDIKLPLRYLTIILVRKHLAGGNDNAESRIDWGERSREGAQFL